jgi:predicted SprT family Zn-dependent metalloprotease
MTTAAATSITRHEYVALDDAYKDFNRNLFAGQLPECLITLNRHPKARGFFCADRFQHRGEDRTTAEIALNPDTFDGRSDLEILSTLTHEQVHLWQFYFGKASRAGYHNKQWADKMASIGLMPSSTGAPGGARVGQHMTHYMLPGERFATAAQQLIASGFKLSWQSPTGKAGSAQTTRAKFTCPNCQQHAWARPSAKLLCGDCSMPMIAITAPAGGNVELLQSAATDNPFDIPF